YDQPRMVEKTKVRRPTVRTIGPTVGRSANAACVSPAPLSPLVHSPELTMTRPVMRQTTTVSQNVPVDDTSAWRTGFFVCAAAATIGALPSPDSFENNPRATPKRIASFMPAPRKPPAAAWPFQAPERIVATVSGTAEACMTRRTVHPAT